MNGRVWLAALLVVLVAFGGYALAQERLGEMVDEIEDALEDGEERDAFLEGVEEYMDERDEALEQLVELAAETGESELRGYWEDVVEDMLDLPVLDDLDDELSSEAALDLYEQFVDEEREWLYSLSRINPVVFRDGFAQSKVRLVHMTEQLEDLWAELLSDDSQIDARELAEIRRLSETYARTTAEMRASGDRRRGYLNLLSDFASNDMVGSRLPIPGVMGDILSMLAQTARVVSVFRGDVDASLAQLDYDAAEQLKLLEQFLATRTSTQLFVDENDMDVVREQVAAAESELRAFESTGTSRQRSDAARVTAQIRASLTAQVSEINTVFNGFVVKHWGRFFGPIVPEVREALLETQVWATERSADDARRRDLYELLRDWRDESNSLFGFDFSRTGITQEERDFILDYLDGDIKALARAMEEGSAFIQTLTTRFDRTGLEAELE